jgi:simple sugar transport system permease protein
MTTKDEQGAQERSQRRALDAANLLGLGGLDTKLLRLLAIVVLIFIGMSAAMPDRFPTAASFGSMAVQFPEIGILALAIMITMLTGGIDLSIISTANLAGILAAITLTWLVPATVTSADVAYAGVAAGIAVALVVGALAGLFNGLLITVIGITPILATLGTMTLYAGLSIVITGGTAVFAIPEFLFLGGGSVLGLPMPLLIFALAAIFFALLLNRTAFGLRLVLLGTNPTAARFSGINSQRVLIWTYVLSGVLAAIAGIIFLGRNNSAKSDYATSYVLQAILVAILGGVNPYGGFGRVGGVVLAVLGLQFLSTGFNMLLLTYSGSNFFKEFAWGLLLLLVMVIDALPRRSKPTQPVDTPGAGLQPKRGET